MKKQNILYKLSFIFLLISALVLTSCANLFNDTLKEKATVYISLDASDSRAVLPTYDFSAFNDFTLTGKKGNATEKSLGTWDSYSKLKDASVRIETGKWTFTLAAKYGNEDFSGTASAEVSEGKQITLNFALSHGSASKGAVDIKIRYPLTTNVTSVDYSFGKLDGSTSVVSNSISGDGLNARAITIQKDNLTSGKYLLQCDFYAGSDKLGSYNEVIIVESGITTELDFEIPYLSRAIKNDKVAETKSGNLDFIFNNTTLGKTTITIKRSQWNELCNNYRYFFKNENCVHVDSYQYEKDGKYWTLQDVGFRLRGNTSRFCPQGWDNGNEQGQMNADWSADYYSYANNKNNKDYRQTHFKVDFEEFLGKDSTGTEAEQKMAGCLKGLALKRMDSVCGKEVFCYDLFRKNGIWTAPRACQTRVIIKIKEDETDNSITTVDYGVYEMFEEVNKQSLKARARENDENTASNAWKNSKGNLWKCANDLTGRNLDKDMGVEDIRIFHNGETISGKNTVTKTDEFGGNRIGYVWDSYSLDLKTNKSGFAAAAAELRDFITELNALPDPSSETDTASINTIKAFYEKWFDMDLFLKTYAINIACGMDDDYWGNANNYYLYFDTGSAKATKKVYFIPFDYDNTLGASINGDKEGFKHNPLEWGRGKNRPLMDKLLKVPEFKEKFVNYLLDVTSNEYWDSDRCAKIFQDWGAMCGSYMHSPDLDFHIGDSDFSDKYSWNPSGYALFHEPNIFDATSYYFRKNLGKDVSNHPYAIYDPEPLPESEAPDEVSQTTTGNSSTPDGEKVTASNTTGDDLESIFTLSVTPKYNGLYIEKSHHVNWEHVTIHVYDVTDNCENVRIVTDQLHNAFLYPFVQEGHEYKVWTTAQRGDWSGWADSSSFNLVTTALGGLGNYRVTYSDYRYDDPSISLVFDDLTFIRPQIAGLSAKIDGTLCSEGVWGNDRVYPGDIKFKNSTADLSPAAAFIRTHKRIHVVLTLKLTYDKVNYEYTILENNNNSLINEYPPFFELDTEADTSTSPGLHIKIKEVPAGAYSRDIFINDINVSPMGRRYTEDGEEPADHISDDTWYYPFVKAGETYRVRVKYIGDKGEGHTWSDFANAEASFTPLTGDGELSVGYVSWEINDNKLIFNSTQPVMQGEKILTGDYRVEFDRANGEWLDDVSLGSVSPDVNLNNVLRGRGITKTTPFGFRLYYKENSGNGYTYEYEILNASNIYLTDDIQ